MEDERVKMRLDKMIITVVVVLFILTAGILIIADQSKVYDYEINTTSEKTFPNTAKYVSKLQNDTSEMRKPLERKGDFSPALMLGYLLTAGYSGVQFIFNMISVPFGLAADIYALLEIPPALTGFFTIGLTVLVLFSVIYMFFRFQPR